MQTDDARARAFERALQASLTAGTGVPAGDCVEAETLAAWAEGALRPSESGSVEQHLSSCPSCQAVLATFVRTAPPPQPAAPPFWLRLHLNWLVPLATAAATIAVWLALPGRPLGTPPVTPRAETVADAGRGQAVSPGAVEPSKPPAALTQPAFAPATPTPAPAPPAAAESVPADARPAPTPSTADLQAKVEAELARPRETRSPAAGGGRIAAVAAPVPPIPANATATVDSVVRNRAEMDASKRADAAPSPAAASAAGEATLAPAAAVEPPARSKGFVDVSPPSSASRWRITTGGAVEYLAAGAPAVRVADMPPSVRSTAGSSSSERVCWMVGRAGAVYLTTDGLDFARIAFPETADLVAVRATDARTATVTTSNGRIFQTSDAGNSWK